MTISSHLFFSASVTFCYLSKANWCFLFFFSLEGLWYFAWASSFLLFNIQPIFYTIWIFNKTINNKTIQDRFLKVKNSLLELEYDFIGIKDGKWKELKIKKKKKKKRIKNKKELLFKSIIVSIYDVDRFEKREVKKKRSIKKHLVGMGN